MTVIRAANGTASSAPPSREGWERNQRANASEWASDRVHTSRRLTDYTTPEDIAATIAGLKALWRSLGDQMRTVKAKYPALIQQPGETRSQHTQRWLSMSETERNQLWEYGAPQDDRREIKRALKDLEAGELPKFLLGLHAPNNQHWAALRIAALEKEWWERRSAAVEAEYQQMLPDMLTDDAWEKHQLRRAELRAKGWNV